MANNIRAEIITIGDEILIGQIIDTNSAWIAKELNDVGIVVSQITSISDDMGHIMHTLQSVSAHSNLILVTGGLGPTRDDITKTAINEYFDTHLVLDQRVLKHIEELVMIRGLTMNELNQKQAEVPESATVLHNALGTAPGLWMEKDNRIFVFMPGVPYEMKSIFEYELLPRLKKSFQGPAIVHKTIMVTGIAESSLAILLEPWETALPSAIKLAYLPSSGNVRLRLTAKGEELKKLEEIVALEIEKVKPLISDYYVGENDESLEMIVAKLLKDNHKTVATAESCTGGTIAAMLTAHAGSSAYFKGGVVAYANEIKTNVLNVNGVLLDNYGAVSEQVVLAMAEEVLELIQVDYAVSVSGVAGPDGGTPEKPVGTVWIGVASKNRVIAKKFQFEFDRERNIRRAAQAALNELRKMILHDLEKK